eukprot:gnl/Chilomastix_cuspidata/2416.p1 GENE.gnl/Chilomastix_cuspidata/2416~~gnl/Chilomastix_cuspidata/2416.p1  ORF type:complete len:2529 (-),score=435.73 gnl/Chilomastix_cuspidata/2416:3011-10597(-)
MLSYFFLLLVFFIPSTKGNNGILYDFDEAPIFGSDWAAGEDGVVFRNDGFGFIPRAFDSWTLSPTTDIYTGNGTAPPGGDFLLLDLQTLLIDSGEGPEAVFEFDTPFLAPRVFRSRASGAVYIFERTAVATQVFDPFSGRASPMTRPKGALDAVSKFPIGEDSTSASVFVPVILDGVASIMRISGDGAVPEVTFEAIAGAEAPGGCAGAAFSSLATPEYGGRALFVSESQGCAALATSTSESCLTGFQLAYTEFAQGDETLTAASLWSLDVALLAFSDGSLLGLPVSADGGSGIVEIAVDTDASTALASDPATAVWCVQPSYTYGSDCFLLGASHLFALATWNGDAFAPQVTLVNIEDLPSDVFSPNGESWYPLSLSAPQAAGWSFAPFEIDGMTTQHVTTILNRGQDPPVLLRRRYTGEWYRVPLSSPLEAALQGSSPYALSHFSFFQSQLGLAHALAGLKDGVAFAKDSNARSVLSEAGLGNMTVIEAMRHDYWAPSFSLTGDGLGRRDLQEFTHVSITIGIPDYAALSGFSLEEDEAAQSLESLSISLHTWDASSEHTAVSDYADELSVISGSFFDEPLGNDVSVPNNSPIRFFNVSVPLDTFPDADTWGFTNVESLRISYKLDVACGCSGNDIMDFSKCDTTCRPFYLLYVAFERKGGSSIQFRRMPDIPFEDSLSPGFEITKILTPKSTSCTSIRPLESPSCPNSQRRFFLGNGLWLFEPLEHVFLSLARGGADVLEAPPSAVGSNACAPFSGPAVWDCSLSSLIDGDSIGENVFVGLTRSLDLLYVELISVGEKLRWDHSWFRLGDVSELGDGASVSFLRTCGSLSATFIAGPSGVHQLGCALGGEESGAVQCEYVTKVTSSSVVQFDVYTDSTIHQSSCGFVYFTDQNVFGSFDYSQEAGVTRFVENDRLFPASLGGVSAFVLSPAAYNNANLDLIPDPVPDSFLDASFWAAFFSDASADPLTLARFDFTTQDTSLEIFPSARRIVSLSGAFDYHMMALTAPGDEQDVFLRDYTGTWQTLGTWVEDAQVPPSSAFNLTTLSVSSGRTALFYGYEVFNTDFEGNGVVLSPDMYHTPCIQFYTDVYGRRDLSGYQAVRIDVYAGDLLPPTFEDIYVSLGTWNHKSNTLRLRDYCTLDSSDTEPLQVCVVPVDDLVTPEWNLGTTETISFTNISTECHFAYAGSYSGCNSLYIKRVHALDTVAPAVSSVELLSNNILSVEISEPLGFRLGHTSGAFSLRSSAHNISVCERGFQERFKNFGQSGNVVMTTIIFLFLCEPMREGVPYTFAYSGLRDSAGNIQAQEARLSSSLVFTSSLQTPIIRTNQAGYLRDFGVTIGAGGYLGDFGARVFVLSHSGRKLHVVKTVPEIGEQNRIVRSVDLSDGLSKLAALSPTYLFGATLDQKEIVRVHIGFGPSSDFFEDTVFATSSTSRIVDFTVAEALGLLCLVEAASGAVSLVLVDARRPAALSADQSNATLLVSSISTEIFNDPANLLVRATRSLTSEHLTSVVVCGEYGCGLYELDFSEASVCSYADTRESLDTELQSSWTPIVEAALFEGDSQLLSLFARHGDIAILSTSKGAFTISDTGLVPIEYPRGCTDPHQVVGYFHSFDMSFTAVCSDFSRTWRSVYTGSFPVASTYFVEAPDRADAEGSFDDLSVARAALLSARDLFALADDGSLFRLEPSSSEAKTIAQRIIAPSSFSIFAPGDLEGLELVSPDMYGAMPLFSAQAPSVSVFPCSLQAELVRVLGATEGGKVTDEEFLQGGIEVPFTWIQNYHSGEEVLEIDCSSFIMPYISSTEPNVFSLKIDSVGASLPFAVSGSGWDALHLTLARGLFHQRCGSDAIHHPYTEKQYSRGGCHQASDAVVWDGDYAGQRVSVEAGGWHDAGDYGKYMGSLANTIAIFQIALDIEKYADPDNKAFYSDSYNIPNDGLHEGMPDLVKEAVWGTRWLISAQAPNGGFYHKLVWSNWFYDTPDAFDDERYLVSLSTHATASGCAVMAVMARNLYEYEPDLSIEYLNSAFLAWNYLKANPTPSAAFVQPDGIGGGEYSDSSDVDNRAWCAIELARTIVFFLDTAEPAYASLNDGASSPVYLADVIADIETTHLPAVQELNESGMSSCDFSDAFYHSYQIAALMEGANTHLAGDAQRLDESYAHLSVRNSILVGLSHTLDRVETTSFASGERMEMPSRVGLGEFSQSSRYSFLLLRYELLVAIDQAQTAPRFAEAEARAYSERFRRGAARSIDIQLGLNPLSLSFVTGVGFRAPAHATNNICYATRWQDGAGCPYPGIPVFGVASHLSNGHYLYWKVQSDDVNYPQTWNTGDPLPLLRRYADEWHVIPMSEYTIESMMEATTSVALVARHPMYIVAGVASVQLNGGERTIDVSLTKALTAAPRSSAATAATEEPSVDCRRVLSCSDQLFAKKTQCAWTSPTSFTISAAPDSVWADPPVDWAVAPALLAEVYGTGGDAVSFFAPPELALDDVTVTPLPGRLAVWAIALIAAAAVAAARGPDALQAPDPAGFSNPT